MTKQPSQTLTPCFNHAPLELENYSHTVKPMPNKCLSQFTPINSPKCLTAFLGDATFRVSQRKSNTKMVSKNCPRCQNVKLGSEFFNCSRSTDGLQAWCKQCKNDSRKGTPARTAERARRRAAKLNASPSWSDDKAISELYRIAKRLQTITGVEYHIDHIAPLQHELVCGLHVAENLQVLPASVNIEKSNSFTPYRYCDGIRYTLDGVDWV